MLLWFDYFYSINNNIILLILLYYFLLIMKQTDFRLVYNWRENCCYGPITFNWNYEINTILVMVFISNMNQTDFRLIYNQRENCLYDPIPFNLTGILPKIAIVPTEICQFTRIAILWYWHIFTDNLNEQKSFVTMYIYKNCSALLNNVVFKVN